MAKRKRITTRIVRSNVGDLVQYRRERLCWTREDLAQASGVTRQTIHRIETSDAIPPSLRTLRKLADALGCNVTALLED